MICPYCDFESDDKYDFVFVLFGPRICRVCEGKFRRKGYKLRVGPEERKNNRDYKKFLAGEMFSEVKVRKVKNDTAEKEG